MKEDEKQDGGDQKEQMVWFDGNRPTLKNGELGRQLS